MQKDTDNQIKNLQKDMQQTAWAMIAQWAWSWAMASSWYTAWIKNIQDKNNTVIQNLKDLRARAK
jgi:hypothetical protein